MCQRQKALTWGVSGGGDSGHSIVCVANREVVETPSAPGLIVHMLQGGGAIGELVRGGRTRFEAEAWHEDERRMIRVVIKSLYKNNTVRTRYMGPELQKQYAVEM